ncbi:DEAD/DEAH box helicase [Pseudobacteroides cellulosolvens]|uniref:Type III restriction protein res subunit n=1 Tax=Pseudobacteroides cellulosolvens ATCC 35603 = DSM 2933 TaxID=398512 RepID=A0A0L6JGI4_9FIRM|nr:DEAD/DEAH box helicase [Pseudobacteroides cellulosolvens]KNY24823.1 type III restriction protein res subunit [Pseudobacteroides cellulosolvens ATCC 35603 = DSM 2933]
MKVTIDSVLRMKEVPPDILEKIKSELTLKNPQYIKKKQLGLPVWNEPELIKLWNEVDIDNQKIYTLPRGYYARLWEIASTRMKIFDERVGFANHIEFTSKPNLRDYQKPAIDRAFNWQQGTIIMPCGAGKTETALGVVTELKQPTLWITHTMDLLKQSMDRAIERCGLTGDQIGVIQGKKFKVGSHITFATVQTLAKRDLKEIHNIFGCIVIDECHLTFKDQVKARLFESVISQFPAFYRIGITASENRSDGLIETMFHVIGPKIYEVKQETLNELGNVVVPRVEFIDTYFIYNPDQESDGEEKKDEDPDDKEKTLLNVKQMVCEMKMDPERNDLIMSYLRKCTNQDFVIVLGDSLEQLETLRNIVHSDATPSAFVCGETPKKKREKIMEDMRNGKYTYLFATYQLAKLGLDIPRLNKLFLITPKKDKTSIQQGVGRIMRMWEGKETPVVYDFFDYQVKQCVYWAKERRKVYKNLGCQIFGGPKIRGI